MIIKNIKHKGLRNFHESGDRSGIPANLAEWDCVVNPHKSMSGAFEHPPNAITGLYLSAGMQLTHPVRPEVESEEYGACRFGLDGHAVVYRVAKTTPTKIGQFVTIWKRQTPDSPIAPLDSRDDVQFVVICVADSTHKGQFVFDRNSMLAKGIMSRDGAGGKRAIRVYPPWSTPTAKEAIRSQQWQMQHFLPLTADGAAETADRVRQLFQP